MDGDRITSVEEVPDDSTILFRVRDVDVDEVKEAILVRIDDNPSDGGGNGDGDRDAVAGWLNYCRHFTHVKLDKGSGAPIRGGELICQNHGAYFEEDTGLCTHGPCEGAYLQPVAVTVRGGDVYLVDEDYEFIGHGPEATDDLDLSSDSNFEF